MCRFFGTQICQWQVLTGGIVALHQPPRAISSSEKRFTRLLRNRTIAIYLENVTARSYLNKEGGGDSISSSEQADIGHSDILSGSWNFSDTNLSPGSGQSEYGRSFQRSGVREVVPESLGGQQNTQVDLFASHDRLTFQYIYPYTGRTGEQRDQCSGSEVEVQEEVCVSTSSTDSVYA